MAGHVSVNGRPVTAVTMQRLSGYVLQDDVLPGTSTVEEYLRQVRPVNNLICTTTEIIDSRWSHAALVRTWPL